MARILVLDDDPHIRELLETLLELEGYEVITAPDGRLGMELFRSARPDLVITDMIMPDQEGIETIRMIRRLDPDVSILAISGNTARLAAGRTTLDAARLLGADRSLAKPFGAGELRRAVADLLEPKATEDASG